MTHMTAKEERDQEILRRLLEADTVQRIAEETGCSIMRVYRIIKEYDLTRVYLTNEELKLIMDSRAKEGKIL